MSSQYPLRDVAVEAVPDQRGPHLALERGGAPARDEVEHAALEHVGAGADELLALGGPLRLLDELAHGAVGLAAHEPVGARVLDLDERERGARAGALVLRQLALRGRCP